jgi:hypothetical protein
MGERPMVRNFKDRFIKNRATKINPDTPKKTNLNSLQRFYALDGAELQNAV